MKNRRQTLKDKMYMFKKMKMANKIELKEHNCY